MKGGFQIIRIWGIPIRIHFSWLLVFGLVTWSLAAGYFPHEYPGWAGRTYWAVGAVTALVFFASVLVHELGHSWVALRNRIPIRGITLFIFGGVAQIAREPSAAGAELRIALAGPATSFALAGLFAGTWWLVREVPVLAAPTIWLARINSMMALFNLVPGFPLDGGRLLRALLWRWTGSQRRASEAASTIGQLVAFGFIGLGILMVLGGNVIGGMWITFIGWFLQNAAAASYAEADIREMLRAVRVGQVMTRSCPRVELDWSLDRVIRDEVLGAGRRCFAVTEDGRLVGLLTLHDIKAIPKDRWATVTVRQTMLPGDKVITVTPETDLLAALERMDDTDVAQMPVVEAGVLLGLVAREHVLRYVRARAELGI